MIIGLPLGPLPIDIGSFIVSHPSLIHEVAGHALAHTLYSYCRHKRRGNRRQMRKAANMKRRWFVDNIIMHHRRLHERNREIVVSSARSRVLARRQAEKKSPPLTQSQPLSHQRTNDVKWQTMVDVKERAQNLRGMVDARRLRAKSKWLSATNKN